MEKETVEEMEKKHYIIYEFIGKVFAMESQWSDRTCNLVTVPQQLNLDFNSMLRDMNIYIFSHTDGKGQVP